MTLVSCLCPTYNRAPHYLHLLEETVESFRSQRIPEGIEAELVIVNDCPGQILCCNLPGVRIINREQRIESLGQKFNMLATVAHGEILLPWEDDDISLPSRIEQAVNILCQQHPDREPLDFSGAKLLRYWKPPQVWYLEGGHWDTSVPGWRWQADRLNWKHSVGVRHHASAFTRAAFVAVGGYPHLSGNQDAVMDQKLLPFGCNIVNFPMGIPPEQWQYIYRWGVSPNHLSGNPDHEAAWRQEALKPIVQGQFEIKPKWYADYEGMCQDKIRQESSLVDEAISRAERKIRP